MDSKIILSAVDKTGAAFKSAQKNISDLARGGSKLVEVFGGLGPSLGVSLSIAGLAAFTKSAIDAADRLDEMRERTGVAVETLNGLDYAMKLSGGSSDDLEKGLQAVNIKLSEFAAGDKKTTALFRQLGIDAKDAEGVLLQLADVFPKLGQADQVRIGNELLGKSYRTMVPLLAQGREGLQGMIEEGQRLNPITAEMARKSAELNDNLDRFAWAAKGAAVPALNLLIPKLSDLAVFTQRAIDKFGVLGGLGVGLVGGGTLQMLGVELNELKRAENEVQELFAKRGEMLKQIRELDTTASTAVYGVTRDAAKREADSMRQELQGVTTELDRAIKVRNRLQEQSRTGGRPMIPQSPLENAGAGGGGTKPPKEFDYVGEVFKASQGDLEKWADGLGNMRDRYVDLIDPVEKYRRQLAEVRMLQEKGFLNADQALEAEFAIQEAMNGTIGKMEQLQDKAVEASDTMTEFAKEAARGMQSALADFLTDPFHDGLDGMLEGFGNMLQRMIAEAAAANLMENLFGESFGKIGKIDSGSWVGQAMSFASALFSESGNAFTPSGVQAFAAGGAFGKGEILTRPTAFRFAAGGAFRTGVAGEAGPEGALPLKRMSNGKLGVLTEGGGAQAPNVTVNMVVNTPDANSFRRSQGQIQGELTRAVQRGVRYL